MKPANTSSKAHVNLTMWRGDDTGENDENMGGYPLGGDGENYENMGGYPLGGDTVGVRGKRNT